MRLLLQTPLPGLVGFAHPTGGAYPLPEGANRATIEDLTDLTTIPERIKSRIGRSDEAEKQRLTREMDTYGEVSKLGNTAFVAYIKMNPVAPGLQPATGARDEFYEASAQFAKLVDSTRIYLPKKVVIAVGRFEVCFIDRKMTDAYGGPVHSRAEVQKRYDAMLVAFLTRMEQMAAG